MYCLNYAGCKGKTVCEDLEREGCIALTMRDVKFITCVGLVDGVGVLP